MKELYEKIMASEELQKKIMKILAGAEEKGEVATKEAIVGFAKEQGYEVAFGDVKAFLEGMQEGGELSDTELDAVAGGKASPHGIVASIIGIGLACALASAVEEARDSCKAYFVD